MLLPKYEYNLEYSSRILSIYSWNGWKIRVNPRQRVICQRGKKAKPGDLTFVGEASPQFPYNKMMHSSGCLLGISTSTFVLWYTTTPASSKLNLHLKLDLFHRKKKKMKCSKTPLMMIFWGCYFIDFLFLYFRFNKVIHYRSRKCADIFLACRIINFCGNKYSFSQHQQQQQ